MKENQIKECLESLCTSLLDGVQKRYLEDGRTHEDLSLTRYEENYFKKVYPLLRDLKAEITLKLKERNIKLDPRNELTLVNLIIWGEEISNDLKDLFRKHFGFTCCADKAGFVIGWQIDELLGVSRPVKPTGKYTFSDPKMHSKSPYRDFLSNHPLVHSRRIEEYIRAYKTLDLSLAQAANKIKRDGEKLSDWFLNSQKPEIIKVREFLVPGHEKKNLTYTDLAKKRPDYLRDYLKSYEKWVTKLYKREIK